VERQEAGDVSVEEKPLPEKPAEIRRRKRAKTVFDKILRGGRFKNTIAP
jgi:hypothetical protein